MTILVDLPGGVLQKHVSIVMPEDSTFEHLDAVLSACMPGGRRVFDIGGDRIAGYPSWRRDPEGVLDWRSAPLSDHLGEGVLTYGMRRRRIVLSGTDRPPSPDTERVRPRPMSGHLDADAMERIAAVFRDYRGGDTAVTSDGHTAPPGEGIPIVRDLRRYPGRYATRSLLLYYPEDDIVGSIDRYLEENPDERESFEMAAAAGAVIESEMWAWENRFTFEPGRPDVLGSFGITRKDLEKLIDILEDILTE